MLENKAGFRNYKLLSATVAHSSPVATQSRVPKLSYLVQHHISVAISCCRDICSCSSSDRTTTLCPAKRPISYTCPPPQHPPQSSSASRNAILCPGLTPLGHEITSVSLLEHIPPSRSPIIPLFEVLICFCNHVEGFVSFFISV